MQKKKPNMFSVRRSTSATFVLPVYTYIYITDNIKRYSAYTYWCIPTWLATNKNLSARC